MQIKMGSISLITQILTLLSDEGAADLLPRAILSLPINPNPPGDLRGDKFRPKLPQNASVPAAVPPPPPGSSRCPQAAGPGAMRGGGAGLRLLLGAGRAAGSRGAAAGSGAAMVRPGRGRALWGRAAISGPFLPVWVWVWGSPSWGCSFSRMTAWLIGRAN